MSWLSLWFLQEVIQRKTLAPLVVLGKKLEFYSWVSSFSNLKPICESPVFWVRILQHRSVIIFWYFCAEQMALVALKELRHSQFFHCWVLLINSKDQNVTFSDVLTAVCVLKPTCLCSSALELEQSWLYPHTIRGTAAPCSRLCEECLHPRLEKDTTHSLSRALPGTWAPNNPSWGEKIPEQGIAAPPEAVRAQQEWPVTGNEPVTLRSGSGRDVTELPGHDRAHECNYFL